MVFDFESLTVSEDFFAGFSLILMASSMLPISAGANFLGTNCKLGSKSGISETCDKIFLTLAL